MCLVEPLWLEKRCTKSVIAHQIPMSALCEANLTEQEALRLFKLRPSYTIFSKIVRAQLKSLDAATDVGIFAYAHYDILRRNI